MRHAERWTWAALSLTAALWSCVTADEAEALRARRARSRELWEQAQEARRKRDRDFEQQWRDEMVQATARPTPEELAAADPGPLPEGWRTSLEAALREQLRDPPSGVFRFSEPEKVGVKAGEGAPFEYLWRIRYEVNAKNAYGGYTGFQWRAVFIHDGRWLSAEALLEAQREWCRRRDAEMARQASSPSDER